MFPCAKPNRLFLDSRLSLQLCGQKNEAQILWDTLVRERWRSACHFPISHWLKWFSYLDTRDSGREKGKEKNRERSTQESAQEMALAACWLPVTCFLLLFSVLPEDAKDSWTALFWKYTHRQPQRHPSVVSWVSFSPVQLAVEVNC